MPRISMSKESLAGQEYPSIPDGLYELRLDGFEPQWSKNKDSQNLRPVLKIVNHPTLNDQRIFDNLNTKAGWIIQAFSHAFGQSLVDKGNGEVDMPGEFIGPDNDPTQWHYNGPLTGAVAKVILRQVPYNGKMSSKVDQYLCTVPGCQEKHPNNLAS
jgi:hypothetical protein